MTIVPQTHVYGESGSGRFKYGSLAETHPHLISQWSPLNDREPSSVTPGSAYKALWICPEDNTHIRLMEVYRRTRGTACPECNVLTVTHPDIALEWSEDNDRLPSSVPPSSAYKAKWVCDSGHQWTALVHSRTAGRGCQECFLERKRTATPGVDDLATMYPELAAEWSPENDRDVATVSYGSVYEATWICQMNPDHTWVASVNTRTNNRTGCPKCGFRKTSNAEQQLLTDLSKIVDISEEGTDLRWANGVTMAIDILAESGNRKFAIEYDGSYWHKDTADRDLTKTMALLDAGYTVVRVREQSRQFSLPLLPLEHPNLHQIPHTLTRTDSQDFSAVTKLILSLS